MSSELCQKELLTSANVETLAILILKLNVGINGDVRWGEKLFELRIFTGTSVVDGAAKGAGATHMSRISLPVSTPCMV